MSKLKVCHDTNIYQSEWLEFKNLTNTKDSYGGEVMGKHQVGDGSV